VREVARLQGERWALWRSNADPVFPWLGVMISSVVTGIWYWCTDQYIVQRTLAARSLQDARRGALWGGFLKVWPVFIFLVPGMIGYALHLKGVIRIPEDASGQVMGDMVFPTLVSELLPLGLRGLVVGGLLSALMSSLSSLFNSCATLFTVDVYEKLRPGRPERELVRVGRLATAVVVALGLLWIPIMKVMAESKAGLYDYLQNVQGFLAPPITAVFLLGLASRRINAQGAVWGLAVGFVLGMGKLTLQSMVQSGALSAATFLGAIGAFNGYYFSGLLFLVSVLVIVGVSLRTAPPPEEKIRGLTFGSVAAQDRADSRRTWDWRDVVLTTIVLGL
ncbi:sodium:solute symporter family transporter, partial [Rhodothermus bifroesti]|uniref:sodium:solute symporter family transporter n=1 Tax=Rhodothermus bifroesti TaxID=2823335 RepID=UPI0039E94D9B